MDWRVVVVGLSVLLSGCGTFLTPSAPQETVTPAPVPTTSPEPPSETELAPGLGARGSFNATRLADAHRQAASNRSYVWRERLNVTAENGTTPIIVRSQLRTETEGRYLFRTSSSDRFWYHTEFANGTDRFQRRFVAGGVALRKRPMATATHQFTPLATAAITQYLAVDEVSISRSSANGEPVYLLTADSDAISGLGDLRNYSVEAKVTPAGFVHSLRVHHVSYYDDQRQVVRYRMGYRRLGNTTVERPVWVDSVAE